jgi:hypothetical protein
MAAPNIVGVTSIIGKTAVLVANSTPANVVANPTSSNTVLKVNTVTVANFGSSIITANVDIFRSSVGYLVIGNVSIPANSTMVVSGKDTAFYLEEGDGLRTTTSNTAHVISSYEIIS